MGGCSSTGRFDKKLYIGKNKSFAILKDTLIKSKNTYNILFCFEQKFGSSIITDINDNTEKGTYTIKLIKKSNQSSIKNTLSSIGKSIQYAFNKANDQGCTKIFIDQPADLISKDITFILQQLIRMLLTFDVKGCFPKIKAIYFDWEGVEMSQLVRKVEKDLSMI